MANTIILFWNPTKSKYTKYDFARDCISMKGSYNWSVGQHKEAKSGDRFFLVRYGEGIKGICMSGVFTSEPRIGPDWDSKGRTLYYMDLKPDVVIDSELHQILTCETLTNEIPEFDWESESDGRILEPKYAEKLEKLWQKFLFAHLEMFKVHAWWRRYAPPYIPNNANQFNEDEQFGIYYFTDDGKIIIENNVFDIDAEGDTLTEAKDNFLKKLREQNYDGEIHIFYNDIGDEKNQELFDRAVELAFTKHSGQTDKAGKKYITHVIRVCAKCHTDEERIVAMLHDTIEDTDVTIETLNEQGFPIDIINAVLSVTKVKGESYEDFIRRAAMSPIGRKVKLADLEDNMTVQRLTSVTIDDVERLNRYVKAWHYLMSKNSSQSSTQ